MESIEILNKIGFTGFFFTIVTFFIYRYFNKKDKKEEKDDGYDSIVEDLECNKKKIEEIDGTINILLEAIMALLREQIIKMYNHYYVDLGYFPIYARESLEHIYNSYEKLGGNGVAKDLFESLMGLPTEK